MDEFFHWPKPYLLLSTTSDEILLWMISNWMKNYMLSDSKCSTVTYYAPKNLQGMTHNVGLTFSVGDTTLRFAINIEQLEFVTLNILLSVVTYELVEVQDLRIITHPFRGIYKIHLTLIKKIRIITMCNRLDLEH